MERSTRKHSVYDVRCNVSASVVHEAIILTWLKKHFVSNANMDGSTEVMNEAENHMADRMWQRKRHVA